MLHTQKHYWLCEIVAVFQRLGAPDARSPPTVNSVSVPGSTEEGLNEMGEVPNGQNSSSREGKPARRRFSALHCQVRRPRMHRTPCGKHRAGCDHPSCSRDSCCTPLPLTTAGIGLQMGLGSRPSAASRRPPSPGHWSACTITASLTFAKSPTSQRIIFAEMAWMQCSQETIPAVIVLRWMLYGNSSSARFEPCRCRV